MSKSMMELRSSRSRSRTPFLTQEVIDKEIAASGNHVEKTVVRSTRRTTVIKTNESASSSTDEINTIRDTYQSKPSRRSATSETQKSDRSLRSRLIKTSDYSSEDGENEVSSTKTISQNERNQLIENARTLANGTDMPALELYRKSGRYWDVYPKTDWTYSYHSKDRVEIAPGVVAMPNMSRKTIHSLDESNRSHSFESTRNLYSENVSHKNINTEDTFTAKYSGGLNEGLTRSSYNSNSEDYSIKRRKYSRWSSFKSTVTRIFTSIFTSIFTVFYYTYRTQTSIFSYIHWTASKVMLWDTYLLWKSRPGDKATKLVLLCLLPLLVFGGLWFLSSLGSALYGAVANYTASSTNFIPTLTFWDTGKQENSFTRQERDAADFSNELEININGNIDRLSARQNFEANSESKVGIGYSGLDSVQKPTIIEEKIVKLTEKIYLEPPSASEVAGSLTKEQIEAIALAVKNSLDLDSRSQVNTDELVEKIVQNPNFVNIINNYYQTEYGDKIKLSQEGSGSGNVNEDLLNKHQILIDTLLKEVESMKGEIWLSNKHRSEDYARLSLDIKKCCHKRPIINFESYVTRVVTDLLNNPDFLRNQKGLNEWLRSLFIAKQDLEYRLGNLTGNMDAKMAALVESNSQILMDKVAARLLEINRQHVEIRKTETLNTEHSLTDEGIIRKIVKDALTIYDADRTGLVDYAMETMGGQIVTTRCTETYHYGKAVVSILGIPLWHPSNSPRTVITPSIAPGECWAFQNFPGFIAIKLSSNVKIEAFSMEHISRLLVPEGKIDSAPKEFEVYGLKIENDREPVLLGSYTYNYHGDPVQFFLVEKVDQIFDMVEIRIISNHGNPNYTCLYRFRVHGKIRHDHESR